MRDISSRVTASAPDFKVQSQSTPVDPHTARPSEKGHLAKIQGAVLMRTVGFVPKASTTYFEQQRFASSLRHAKIRKWLKSDDNKVYGSSFLKDEKDIAELDGGWSLPNAPEKEKELYAPQVSILTEILDQFVKPKLGPGVKREVINSHKMSLAHKDNENRTSPDLVICATGPSFEIPADANKAVGYANVITFFDAKLDKYLELNDNLKQMAVYSQQIFTHQPNRIFVRGLLISETRAMLVHFDRAGGQKTQLINLNREADLFVRIVVELCETNERKIGFDDTIRWNIVGGRKVTGTMKFGPEGQERVYNLVDPRPISHSSDICGYASTLWAVSEQGPEAQVFFVKDSWPLPDRTPELELLLKAAKIKGVSKFVEYYFRNFTAASFRCESTIGSFVDRRPVRILMRAHGRQIDDFSEPLEVLHALHDGLVALFELYGHHILHRDITNKTILLGGEGAEVGWRGVVLDLGAALDFDPKKGDCSVSKQARLGTRFFQSCMILNFLNELNDVKAPAHDHMDDIESVFNLCSHLFFNYRPDGTLRGKKDRAGNVIKGWDSELASDALAFKSLLFDPALSYKRAAVQIVTESWGAACGALFKSFLEWVWGIQQQKAAIVEKQSEKQAEVKMQKEVEKKKTETQREEENEEEEEEEKDEKAEEKAVKAKGGYRKVEKQVESDVDNPFIDKIGTSDVPQPGDEEHDARFVDVAQAFKPIPSEPEEKVALKQGLFSPLMDEKATREHFYTVIGFFTTAIEKIKVSGGQDGPPPSLLDKTPKRKAGKTDAMDIDSPDYKYRRVQLASPA